jgi:kanamycin nucleotidyltransferase
MNHEDRRALAESVVTGYFEWLVGRGLVGGVTGSNARGDDTEHSDLDVNILTVGEGEAAYRHHLVRGVPVSVWLCPIRTAAAAVEGPSPSWAGMLGSLETTEVLRGDASVLAGLLETARAVPLDRCRAALRDALPGLVFESWGRVRSCAAREDPIDLRAAAIETAYESATVLCLLNGRWTTRDYFGGIREAAAFECVPAGYLETAEALWTATDPAAAVEAAEALGNGLLDLLHAEGIVDREALLTAELEFPQ